VPLAPKKLDRRISKGGLRGMFTRTKDHAENGTILSVKEESGPTSATTDSTLTPVTSAAATPPTPATPATPVPSRHSRLNIKSQFKSVKQKTATGKPSPSSTQSSPRTLLRTSTTWDPPPLFQAYPQAIKHATLAASALSADVILRMSSRKKDGLLRDDNLQKTEEGDRDQEVTDKKAEKAKSKHRRQLSGSMSKGEWTQKIFIIVTSGYILQYAGEGNFDRLPEKMMQLGTESVAFASDAIPGKHWVLQVSQAMDANGAPSSDSRSLLSRLAFRGADYRRTATSLLLVMNSAEDMNSWLGVVRREIEALGGKKHVSETGKPKPDEKVMQLRAQPSHRFLREPEQLPKVSSPASSNFPTASRDDDFFQLKTEKNFRDLHDHHTSKAQKTIADGSEGLLQEGLRDSTNRLSFMSSGQRTRISSSLSTSPTRESCSTIDDFFPKRSIEDQWMRPNATALDGRRKSMQTVPIPVLEAHTTSSLRPPSTYGTPSYLNRGDLTAPPLPQNLSGPNSLSKRISFTGKSYPREPFGTDSLSVPNIVTITYESADIQSKPLPGVLQQRHTCPSTFEPSPTYEPCSDPHKMQEHGALDQFTQLKELRGRRSNLKSNTLDDDRVLNFQFPQRYSTSPKPLATRNSDSDRPKASTVSLSTPLPESPMTVEPPELPTHITIDQETSNIPPISFSRKLSRPISMQMRSSPAEFSSKPLLPSTNLHASTKRRSSLLPPPSGNSTLLPKQTLSYNHVNIVLPLKVGRQSDESKIVAVRRSMPLLADGPPLAPPPRYALPPLPATQNAQSPPSFRNSLLV
jgi:hypothetical protein